MIRSPYRHDVRGLALWIYVSTWCSAAGWILSAIGCLNGAGYAAASLIFVVGLVFMYGRDGLCMQTSFRRFIPGLQRSRVPVIWLLLTVLTWVGGAVYSPNNYDYLTYRFPRVLHWCSDYHWEWIDSVDIRVNLSAPGFEWCMAPLFVFFKTDRLFFLINFVSYLLLPGLVFSVFQHLGISRRLSWWWMWVLPCGYCYILQAASAGNDCFSAVYLLAALHYLFLARTLCSMKNLGLSFLAIALLTGAKATNLPLVLPWLFALFLNRECVWEKGRSIAMVLVLFFAAAVSFLPVALLNIHFTGSYSGDPRNTTKVQLANPFEGVLGNSLQLTKDNLAPPLLPRVIDWGSELPPTLKANLFRDFPRLDLHSGELQIEEEAGLGLGEVLFIVLFMAGGIWARVAEPGLIVARNSEALWVVSAGVLAWLAYLSKMGSEATSRLIAAYYPLLIAGALVAVSLDGRIVRRRVFKWVGCIVMLSALPVVILCPARPLFPVQGVSRLMASCHAPAGMIARYNLVYSVYAARADVFKELTASIPPGEQAVGFLEGGDAPETSLWRPFGTRKVVEVTPEDSAVELRALGIHFVVVSKDALIEHYQTTAALLAAKWSASLVVEKSIILKAHRGPETWFLFTL